MRGQRLSTNFDPADPVIELASTRGERLKLRAHSERLGR